jgi:hypothetical protein
MSEAERVMLQELCVLRDECVAAVQGFNWDFDWEKWDENKAKSARNMIHCLWLRSKDRTELSARLKAYCLDIGSHETHNMAAIETAISIFARLTSSSVPVSSNSAPAITHSEGRELLLQRKVLFFGPRMMSFVSLFFGCLLCRHGDMEEEERVILLVLLFGP